MNQQKNKVAFQTSKEPPTLKTRSDLMSILSAMEKAMCRQHIMWPIDGELPCETDQTCLKSDLCREMAEEVMDYSRTLKSTRE